MQLLPQRRRAAHMPLPVCVRRRRRRRRLRNVGATGPPRAGRPRHRHGVPAHAVGGVCRHHTRGRRRNLGVDLVGCHFHQRLIDFDAIGLDRASVISKLHDLGIGTQVHYLPVNKQPYYQDHLLP